MSAKAVQISLDEELLRRIDADAETVARGRSAFIRAAVDAHLAVKRRRLVDAEITRAYQGGKDSLLPETADFLGVQAWPDE